MTFTNELIHESSPYLLQHAHNPVQWLPWGDKALHKAKDENKPIFLSIGYSACHWCHVMEKESFMDEDVADILNEFFIPIKVDREERPDVDHIYMTALQTMSEHGGWPLSMFLTPNAEPFYGGTFFPKHDSHGMPSFTKVLKTIARTWGSDQANILTQSKQLTQHLRSEMNRSFPVENVAADFLKSTLEKLDTHIDHENGGFYAAPKFPHAFYLDLYVEALRDQKLPIYEKNLSFTLRKMAEGGIYDHLAGGFHRYATDSEWLVPHFEKMLYDNAILATTYFEAANVVESEFNTNLAKDICDYVLREMTHPEGPFYSSTDADSEGVEGRFFVWTRTELRKILGEKDGDLFSAFYDIRKDNYEAFDLERGTPPHEWFDGHVLHLVDRFETLLEVHKTNRETIYSLRQKVHEFRKKHRTEPFRDEKILVSWNGLMIQALSLGFIQTGELRYYEAAKRALDFILKDNKIFRTLEDYANFIAGLLSFHRAGGETHYLHEAKTFCDKALSLFWDENEGFFYYTVSDSDLIVRAKNVYDQAIPSSHGMMASNLFYLARMYANTSYQDILDRMLVNLSGFITKMPHAVSTIIKVASRNSIGGKDYVLVHASSELRQELAKSMYPTDTLLTEKDSNLELLRDKVKGHEASLFVCYNKTCDAPIRGEAKIREFIFSLR